MKPDTHEGRLYVRGVMVGVRLLADMLARGDTEAAKRLIAQAEAHELSGSMRCRAAGDIGN